MFQQNQNIWFAHHNLKSDNHQACGNFRVLWWNKLLNPWINYSEVYLLNGKLPAAGEPSGDQTGGAAASPYPACHAKLGPCA